MGRFLYQTGHTLPLMGIFRCPNIKNIDFNNKNSKNEVNSPDIVYLFFGELISTKRGHYRFFTRFTNITNIIISHKFLIFFIFKVIFILHF
jgi:hypothetical protein